MAAEDVERSSPPTLEADCVYVQMKKQYRVSRYIRAQWFVNQINKVIQPKQPTESDITEEVEVLSALPRDKPAGWRPEKAHEFAYLVTPATKVTFLAKKYRFVFCLDLSASIATVDIRSETFLFDEVFATLSKCVEKLVMPFNVPGSCVVFQPEIYVTVIAYIPHYTPAVQQVLIQGWPLTPDNCGLFLSKVSAGLNEICIVLAEATAGVAELHDQLRLQSEKLTGGLFEECDEQACATPLVNMVSSDVSTLSMLRYGMLALQLLPENSSAGIVVITDGVISIPNGHQLELLLGSLRGGTVACSFLQLGGSYHAKSSLGYVPYDDLMRFIARATFGAYLNGCLVGPDDTSEATGAENIFHRALLFWSFQEEFINQRLELAKDAGMQYKLLASKGNAAFEQNLSCMPQLRKKQSDGNLNTSLSSVLSSKLREGYALRTISTAKGELEIKLVLPWKFDVNIEYVVMVPWQSSNKNRDSSGSGSQPKQRAGCKFEVYVEASYDFLHDVTCEYFKSNKTRSPFRLMVAQQYWNALKNISSTDQLLVHLHSFNQNPIYYSVPESFRNGVPLFVMPSNSSGHPVLSSNLKNNSAYAPFLAFWKPVSMLDISIWQRWMHMHRVGMLLEHDLPLPKHLQQPNSSGRYDSVQCRQALHRLFALLRDRSSFVLADGHSYVTFLGEGDKPPVSFYVTRVTYKAPCVVIRFAFLGGTPGEERNAIVKDLTQQILSLELSKRVAKDTHMDGGLCIRPPGPRTYRKASCCILFRKPLERILIRHEKMPKDILSPMVAVMDVAVTPAHPLLHHTPHFHRHSGSSGSSGSLTRKGNGVSSVVDPMSQLSRYLHHRRWIWTVQRLPSVPLPLHAVTRILKTLAKMRLEEGFHFAHSSSGILNMALEIEMKNTVMTDSGDASLLPCVVQYMLFPPHSNTTIRESLSDDEDNEMETAEADGELQLVTECWVEPQCGVVVNCPVSSSYLDGKQYTEIPKALFEMDFECLSSLITLEHLNLSCLKPELVCPANILSQRLPPPVTPPVTPVLAGSQPSFVSRSTPDITLAQNMPLLQPVAPEPIVNVVPFPFSIMKLLSKCQQTEVLFSTFMQELRLPPMGGGDGANDRPVDCEGRPRPQPNDLLYEQLLENLQTMHDREVPLGLEEQALLPHEIHNRPRDQHAYAVPFAVPLVQATPITWRCFVASFSGANSTSGSGHTTPNSHVVLTFIPATFSDLQRLMARPEDATLLEADSQNTRDGHPATVHKDYVMLQTESSSEQVVSSSADREALTSSATEDQATNEVCDGGLAEPPAARQLTASHSDPALSSHGVEKPESLPRQRSADIPGVSQSQLSISVQCPVVRDDDGGSASPESQEAGGVARRLVSTTLPVYVYDAPVSAVIGRLVYQGGVRQWKDTYLDLTTRYEDNVRAGSEPSWVEYRAEGSEGSPYKTMSPEPKSDDSEFGSDRFPARKHCSRLRKAFSKSFVYGVFRALRDGLPVDVQDVCAVVEDACEETVLTVDITEFIQAICGHTRDFRIKSTVEHSHRASGVSRQDGTGGGGDGEAGGDAASEVPAEGPDAGAAKADESRRLSGDGVSSLFPVNLLERHHPCDVVQQLHLSIKQRFQELLEEVFQRIPSHPDYYYFCPPCQARTTWGLNGGAGDGVHRNADANAEEEGALCDWDDTDTDRSHNVEFSMDAEPVADAGQSGDEKAAGAKAYAAAAAAEVTSIESCAGSVRSAPSAGEEDSGEEDEEEEEEVMETIREAEPMVPPLFAHLTCLVKTKSGCGSCSLTSLPTCLGEVINCLDDSQPTLDLENIKIRLDFLCLTLPPDVEKLAPGDARLSSSSIMFDSERQHQDDEAESVASIGYQLEVPRDPLHHLPEFQNEVISRCIEKLKWMLRDEMASAALNSFPLTAETLHMVAEHVRSTAQARTTTRLHATTGAPGCQVQQVPLQFVFGHELSFGKFLQEFKQLTLPGYQLEQVDKDYYCVVLDNKDSKVVRRPFGSLVPPLGLRSKSLEMTAALPHEKAGAAEVAEVRVLRPKTVVSDTKLSDEDESGDGGVQQTSFRAWRRHTGKGRTKSAERRLERASSVPLDSLVTSEEPKPEGRVPGASCPMELLELRRKLQEESETLKVDTGGAGDPAANVSTETIVQEQKAVEESESQEALEASTEPTEESAPEQPDGAFRDRTDSLASSLGHGMSFRPPQHLLESTRSTPNAFSEGGGQISNTEDGYDGDSSESDSDRDWMNALETQRSHLPPFWLILCPFLDHVDIFFHVREQPEESSELRQGLVVFESIVGLIQDTCKIVNQILLLQHLNNTRMCNRLLVPEAAEDIWNRDSEMEPANTTASAYDNDGSGDGHSDYLEATLKFKPGAFDCSIVWSTHFTLHPRLNTGPGRSGVSRGLQALRAVLTGFSVNNRRNMFVYQENSGSVFYLRLHEVPCHGRHGRAEDDVSFSGSRSSSLVSLVQKKAAAEQEEEFDFRPRLSSGHSDRDQSHDTVSMTSHASGGHRSKSQQCVVMNVHGIVQPGFAIKEELVSVMQNRLDDAVLEVLTTTLARNPACNLTIDDVQFIQKPQKEPTTQLYCTVQAQLLPYLQALLEYLRQDLHTFLPTPKYTDPKPENHFKPYVEHPAHALCHKDEDVFLFNRFKAMGTPSNGIACIILSMVDAQGRPVQFLSCPLPKAGAFSCTEAPTEYQEVSFLSREEVNDASADGTPGPMAMIRFQVWCVGKDYQEHLVRRLQSTVQHAYWDVLMEYRLLTCPVFREAQQEGEPACFSEPPTPVKVRRTGRVLAEQARDKSFLFGMFGSRGKEMSSSVPDVSEKVKSPKENPTEFNFSDALFTEVPPSLPATAAKAPVRSMEADLPSAENWTVKRVGERLNATFQHAVHDFLEGGVQIGVPSLVVYRCAVKARRAVPLVLKEFQNGLKSLPPEFSLAMFAEEGTGRPSRPTEFVHFIPLVKQAMFPEKYAETMAPGSQRCFIVVGRDENQWRAFMGLSNLATYIENTRATKSHKSTQLFEPYMLPTSAYLEVAALSRTPSTPSSVPPTIAAPPSDKARNTATPADAGEGRQPALIPRQRLLFLRVEDKALTLYLYNWTSDQGQELFKLLGQLVEWHDLRNDFLRSLACQKMGLFFDQPLERAAHAADAVCPRQQQGPLHGLGNAGIAVGTQTASSTSAQGGQQQANPWASLENLMTRHNPPSRHQDGAAAAKGALHAQFGQVLRGVKPRVPMQAAPYANCDDPVSRHGRQVQDVRGLRRRDLGEFRRIYDDKGTGSSHPSMEKMLGQVKREARLVHYCLTPLLFSPTWRLRVAQVRDHTLDATVTTGFPLDCPAAHDQLPGGQRTRHSSGGSQKSVGGDASNAAAGRRMRRSSGVPSVTSGGGGGGQLSPKQHRRSTNEETWHMTVCSHYIQEYIQYLQNLGFMAIQTKNPSSRKSSTMSVRRRESEATSKRQSVGALSLGELPRHCLFMWHLGGLYFFEVGFCDPYVACNLFLVERQRLLPSGTQLYMSQVTSEFIEDLDKIRVNMHMHSFTYDYHLRTIHSYVSGQQLLFKHGYHLTSFLDDFVKYYQKSPNYARNLIYAGSVVIPSVNVAPNQLYNYIIGHNKLYGMKVIRMVPVVCDSSSDLDTEYALVEISNKKVSYRDANDVQQTDSFFVGILTIHDTAPAFVEHNLLALGFYILLTSQRELFPKFSSATGPPGTSSSGAAEGGGGDSSEGCFRPVRVLGGTPGASQPTSTVPSRRSSFVAVPATTERMRTLTMLPQQLVVSPEDVTGSGGNGAASAGIPSVASSSSLSSSNPGGTRSRKTSVFRGICEEEVAYLGYYSSHETLMQEVMSEQATAVAKHLREVVAQASLHCRRDYLWKCLMWRHKNSDDASGTVRENSVRPSISYAELTELLGYVKTAPLDDVDPQLKPLLASHFGWYRNLLRVLTTRYAENHCLFVSPDNTVQYLVVMSPSCADSFILLMTNNQLGRADLRLVHREDAQHEKSATADKSLSGLSNLHGLVEELVATCCFHEWAGLLT
ncbi:KICSTOR complex protein SZT2-like isoform X2 [Amblyomma americanum]